MERLSRLWEMPAGMLELRKPRVILNGRSQVSVENHGGLLEYTTLRIRVRAGHGEVTVEGQELTLSIMDRGVIEISGRIDAVRLS